MQQQSHSVVQPAGPQAGRVEVLWHQLLITAVVVYLVVIATLFVAARRRRTRESPGASERTLRRAVAGAAGASLCILLLFVVASYLADRGVAATPDVAPLHVHVTGHEWWWQLDYVDSAPQHLVTTANEIHVPVRRPILLELTSNDVIHSFWVPNVSGKMDLVPGRTNWLRFQVDSAGTFGGACAEFCGMEHAKMRIRLVAMPTDSFAQWLDHQRDSAMAPTDSTALAGLRVFQHASCPTCHAIRGTNAAATVGPDLTHLASRATIAAGALANTPEQLAAWILAAPAIKPGTLMPATRLLPADQRALLAYLGSLR